MKLTPLMFWLFVYFSVFLPGCGQSSNSGGGSAAANSCSASAVLGSWKSNSTTDVETFNADCSGSSSYCASVFTFPNAPAASGTVLITNSSSNNASGCAAVGTITCAYAVTGSTLTFNCGAGVANYTKQ